MNETLIVLTTFPDIAQAEAFARELVTAKLAACVNVLPKMTSIYQWEGQLEQGEEHQLVIKTRRTHIGAIEQRLKNSHPYELPELLAIPVVTGSIDYLAWINENTHAE